jgi:type III secretory pathway component EscU
MMVLLDALEFSAQKGNMVDVFRRIESLRSLRRLEKANFKS